MGLNHEGGDGSTQFALSSESLSCKTCGDGIIDRIYAKEECDIIDMFHTTINV